MRRTLAIITLLAAAVLLTDCRRKEVIPDDTLADIFHDAFIVNSYVGVERLDLDSLDIYEPIFDKYGYTSRDVRYTVANFSRRKSARLDAVVKQAISRLEEESDELKRQVTILDTVQEVSIRRYRRTVVDDSLIVVRKAADSAKLRVEISPIATGTYNVSYDYEYNEDPTKYPRRISMWVERFGGGKFSNVSYRMRKKESVYRNFTTDSTDTKIVLDLGSYDSKNRNRKQDLTIRNLKVTFSPSPETAMDSMFRSYVDIRVFADEFLPQKDSLALPADSARVD